MAKVTLYLPDQPETLNVTDETAAELLEVVRQQFQTGPGAWLGFENPPRLYWLPVETPICIALDEIDELGGIAVYPTKDGDGPTVF